MLLRPDVLEELTRHGIVPTAEDTPATLRERLNDAYLEEVRRLKQRHLAGEIARRDYARHVEDLKRGFPLLGRPVGTWMAGGE